MVDDRRPFTVFGFGTDTIVQDETKGFGAAELNWVWETSRNGLLPRMRDKIYWADEGQRN